MNLGRQRQFSSRLKTFFILSSSRPCFLAARLFRLGRRRPGPGGGGSGLRVLCVWGARVCVRWAVGVGRFRPACVRGGASLPLFPGGVLWLLSLVSRLSPLRSGLASVPVGSPLSPSVPPCVPRRVGCASSRSVPPQPPGVSPLLLLVALASLSSSVLLAVSGPSPCPSRPCAARAGGSSLGLALVACAAWLLPCAPGRLWPGWPNGWLLWFSLAACPVRRAGGCRRRRRRSPRRVGGCRLRAWGRCARPCRLPSSAGFPRRWLVARRAGGALVLPRARCRRVPRAAAGGVRVVGLPGGCCPGCLLALWRVGLWLVVVARPGRRAGLRCLCCLVCAWLGGLAVLGWGFVGCWLFGPGRLLVLGSGCPSAGLRLLIGGCYEFQDEFHAVER